MRVLMVCLGNICRSPMAQGILEDKIHKLGLDVEVDSAATSDYHIGDSPDPRAIQKMKEHNIDISQYKGRQLLPIDYDKFDRIYVMDSENYENAIKVARKDSDHEKVQMILNVNEPHSNRSVPDPYFGDEEGFEEVYQMLDKACDYIVEDLKNA